MRATASKQVLGRLPPARPALPDRKPRIPPPSPIVHVTVASARMPHPDAFAATAQRTHGPHLDFIDSLCPVRRQS